MTSRQHGLPGCCCAASPTRIWEDDRSVGVSTRLDWLEKDAEGYIPQPYEQLVSTYRRGGQEEAARKVALANGGANARCSTRPGRYGTGCYT